MQFGEPSSKVKAASPAKIFQIHLRLLGADGATPVRNRAVRLDQDGVTVACLRSNFNGDVAFYTTSRARFDVYLDRDFGEE